MSDKRDSTPSNELRLAAIECCGTCQHYHGTYVMFPANDPDNKLGTALALFGQCRLLPVPLPLYDDLNPDSLPYQASNCSLMMVCNSYERKEPA